MAATLSLLTQEACWALSWSGRFRREKSWIPGWLCFDTTRNSVCVSSILSERRSEQRAMTGKGKTKSSRSESCRNSRRPPTEQNRVRLLCFIRYGTCSRETCIVFALLVYFYFTVCTPCSLVLSCTMNLTHYKLSVCCDIYKNLFRTSQRTRPITCVKTNP